MVKVRGIVHLSAGCPIHASQEIRGMGHPGFVGWTRYRSYACRFTASKSLSAGALATDGRLAGAALPRLASAATTVRPTLAAPRERR